MNYQFFIGDIEEFPALDPIPIYPVRVDPHTNEIKVRISPNKLNGNHGVSKPLSKAVKGNIEVVVIIGSGNSTISFLTFKLLRYSVIELFLQLN